MVVCVYDIPPEWKPVLDYCLTVPELQFENRLEGGLALGPVASNPLLASQLFALGAG